MSTLQELVEERVGLGDAEIAHLQAIVSDWQMLADLSFADLLLFCPDVASEQLLVVAQMRPYTAQTVYQEDLVGQSFDPEERPNVVRALQEGRIVREGDPDWSLGVPVREEAIPVTYDGAVLAVVTREANLATVRAPSELELTYLRTADDLARMLAAGTFPFASDLREHELAPRVGDGLIRLEPTGEVTFASPNAISAYRRLGVVDNLVGRHLSEFDLDAKTPLAALRDGQPVESEVEARGAVVMRRLIPLLTDDEVIGGVLLLREVTELRRHERMLQVKDATIREIHHRVKNNLQTVASLLRLQSRRLESDEAKEALGESVRRIASIALVHETLSHDSRERVSFDKVAHRLTDMIGSTFTDPHEPVLISFEGTAGELSAEVATPLALVLSELVQNSVEHAFPDVAGRVEVELTRGARGLRLVVRDDGVGVPDDWDAALHSNLGLQIATTLVESELGGTLVVGRGATGGTVAEAHIPLPE